MGGLASHCHERFYTLGVDGDGRRREMDKEGRNGVREGFSYLRCSDFRCI